jgi:ADP-ribose pyrophosphatase YjhB (NUDIX family)
MASLFLVVKRKGERLAGESDWSFPQGERKDGESMRDAVSRALETFVGTGAQMYFVGYSPMVGTRTYTHIRARTPSLRRIQPHGKARKHLP